MDLPIKCGPPTREYLENTVFAGPWTTCGPGTLRGRAERPATTVWTRSAKPAPSRPRSGEGFQNRLGSFQAMGGAEVLTCADF